MVAVLFVGCGNSQFKTEDLTESQSKEYLEKTKSIIEEFTENGFQNLRVQMNEEMNKAITDESEEQILKMLEDKGAFVEYKEGKALKYFDKKTGTSFIHSQQKVKYEKSDFLFTVNYSEDGKLAGFFIK